MNWKGDIRNLEKLPEWWQENAKGWVGIPFVWKRWDKYREDWTHDHCEYCFACVCSHRDRFPEVDPGERGCYRRAYYAEYSDGTYIWICRTCFKRVQSEFGFTLAENASDQH